MTRTKWRLGRPETIALAGAFVFAFSCVVATPVVRAGIVSTYKVTQVAAPVGVKPAQALTIPDPIVFPEIASGLMPINMPVDAVITGDFTTRPVVSGGVIDSNLVPGVIPVGTPFESYFFHFDPGANGGGYPSTGALPAEIDFSNKILGIQLFGVGTGSPSLTGRLGDGDAISPFGVNYYPGPTSGSPPGSANSPTRGLESGDSIGIYSGGTSIQLAGLAFGGQIDQIRIFVAVPEPASLGMAFMAILGIMGLGRTRSTAARS
jgi:hypothetical protein